MLNRRTFLVSGSSLAVAMGGVTLLPYAAQAAGHEAANTFKTATGEIKIHPVAHASFVMETPAGTIYNDPVGEVSAYAAFPRPDLIVVTHHHGDHLNVDTLSGLVGADTKIIINQTAFDALPADLQARATVMVNGDETTFGTVGITAIPAYNLTEDRLKYHPKGRDNGYVLGIDGTTVYIAGDTEDIPEMRALTGIDIAFVPFNLPYTMDEAAAASAVAAFAPTYCYPYHYRDSDPAKFAALLSESGAKTEVREGPWYS